MASSLQDRCLSSLSHPLLIPLNGILDTKFIITKMKNPVEELKIAEELEERVK